MFTLSKLLPLGYLASQNLSGTLIFVRKFKSRDERRKEVFCKADIRYIIGDWYIPNSRMTPSNSVFGSWMCIFSLKVPSDGKVLTHLL